MASVAGAGASMRNGTGGGGSGAAAFGDIMPSRGGTLVPSLSPANLGRSQFNQSTSSAAFMFAPALTPQQSTTLRSSSGRPGSASQHVPGWGGGGNRSTSVRGGSRSQSYVGGGGRASTPPSFPHFPNPADSTSTPTAAALSISAAAVTPHGRTSYRGPSASLPDRHVGRSHRERSVDEDKASSAAQQQQQQQQGGQDATLEGHPEGYPLLYTPFTLRKRSDFEDMYTACFLTTLQEEHLDNELVFSFKASIAKISSPFARVRHAGIREALQQVRAICVCAAAEAWQGQAEGAQLTARGARKPAQGVAAHSDPSATAGIAGSPPIQRTASVKSQSFHNPPPPHGIGLPPPPPPPASGEAFLHPFDAIRATMAGVAAPGTGGASSTKLSFVPYASDTWNRAQRALAGSDFTSAVFRRVLTPRSEVRAAMNMGGLVNVELSAEDALTWSSRRPPVEVSPLEKLKMESKRAMMAKAGVDRQQQLEQQFRSPSSPILSMGEGGETGEKAGPTRRMTPCGFEVTVPATPIYAMMTDITFEEQELALRLLQGLCLTVNYQRRCIAEGCFFHYATEVFQCFLQHVEAVFTQRRRMHLSRQTTATSVTVNPQGIHLSDGSSNSSPTGLPASSSVYINTPIALGSETFSPKQTAHTQVGSINLSSLVRVPSTLRHGDTSPTSTLDSSPVEVEEEQVAVLVALIDAVEAACHYSPTCLTRLVQTGGVTAMLNLVYSPCVPESVRVAVLDTISLLMQEVAPFRRAVAAPARNAAAAPEGPQQQQQQPSKEVMTTATGEMGVEDTLLATMLEQARTGSYNYPGAPQSGDPPPFMMDRASASKFESAVREWFSKHGLSHAVTGVMELRNFKDWRRLRLVQQQQRAHAATAANLGGGGAVGGEGGAGGGGGNVPGAVASGGGASIETARDSKRATQQRASNVLALLQVIDGKRADLR